MEKKIKEIIDNNSELTKEGQIASYIPALYTPEKRDYIGVSIVDHQKKMHSVGKTEEQFTIQSISKVLTFILAILDNGIEKVFEKVGYEGTDDSYNSFIKLDLDGIYKPANPLINSGALIVTSMIEGQGKEKFERILNFTREITENPSIDLNEEVYLSEKESGYRNKAIANLMKSKGMLVGNVEETLDTYFKQCSMNVTTEDLAKIGSFISRSLEKLELDEQFREKLSVLLKGILLNCGMYDFSTEYSIKVGIPSKSGVGGGILGVLPNGQGIGVYSPALDHYGNSVAGVSIMKDLSKEFHWNIFQLNYKYK
jgi:glutaminase